MKKFITLLICICLSGVLMAQTSVRQVKAGGLLASLSDEDKDTITVLTLKGTMDARDFKTLRDSVLLLNWLDLSQVTIDAYSGSDGTINGATDTKSYDYPLNTIPQMAFLMPDSKAITGKTSLVKVILPNSATHVAEQAFAGCSALNELVIPSSIEHIGNDAFSACTSIQIVRAQGKNPINFYGQTSIFAKEIFATASVFVPQGAQKFYDTALVWKEFSNIVEPISISQSDFTVNAADTSRLNVTVSSNLKWIAKTNSAWLLVSPSDSVDGDKELEITVLPNTKIETRIDSILFVTKNLDSVYVRVNQEMSNPIIICSKSVFEIKKGAQTASFKIWSNTQWDFTTDVIIGNIRGTTGNQRVPWMTMDTVHQKDSILVTLAIEANDEIGAREARISFYINNLLSTIVSVQQYAGGLYLKTEADTLFYPKNQESKSIVISSNDNVHLQFSENWIQSEFKGYIEPTVIGFHSAIADHKFNISVATNKTCVERSAIIHFINLNNLPLPDSLVIIQAPGDSTISISQKKVSLDDLGSTVLDTVAVNFDASADVTADWLTISAVQGNDSVVEISAKPNDEQLARLAYIIIKAGDKKIDSIEVSQAGNPKYIKLSKLEAHLNKTASNSDTIGIHTSLDWTLSSLPKWLSAKQEKSGDSTLLIFSATTNDFAQERNEMISIIFNDEVLSSVSVTQAAADSSISIDPQTIVLGNSLDSELKATVTANFDWSVEYLDSWFSINPESSTGVTDVTFSVHSVNQSLQTRVGKLVVYGKDNGLAYDTLDVIQAAGDTSIIASENTLSIADTANSIASIGISTNVATWQATTNADWVQINKYTGKNNDSLFITASANTSTNSRQAEIIITAGTYKTTLTLIQSANLDLAWTAHTKPSATPKLLTIEFSNPETIPNQFWVSNNSVYNVSYDIAESALRLDFDFNEQSTTEFWDGINYAWITKEQGSDSYSYNPFVNTQDFVSGILPSILSSPKVAIDYKVTDLTDDAYFRVDMIDANGRNSNALDNSQILVSNDKYQSLEYDYSNTKDGWSNAFWDVQNGRYESPDGGLPSLGKAGSYGLPLRFNAVGGLEFFVNSGNKAANLSDKSFSIYIRRIQIGDVKQSGTDQEIMIGRDTLKLSANVVRVSAKAAVNTQISVSYTGNWTAESNQSWLHVNAGATNGSDAISFETDENTGEKARSAQITITAGLQTKVLTVVQSGGVAKFAVKETKLAIDKLAGSLISDTLFTNIPWSYAIDQPWLSLQSTANTSDTTLLQFVAEQNLLLESRSAQVTLSADGQNDIIITITQTAGDTVLLFTRKSVSFTEAGGYEYASVIANVDWTISTNADWLSATKDEIDNTIVLLINAQANTSKTMRDAEITLTAGSHTANLIVSQGVDPQLAWTANKKATTNPSLLTIEFSDTTKLPNAFVNGSPDIFTVQYDENEQALRLDFNYTNETASQFWGNVNYNWVKAINGGDKSFNPFTQIADSIIGVLTNVRDGSIKLKYKTLALDDDAFLRVDLMDANGRWSNSDDNSEILSTTDNYIEREFTIQSSDAYTSDFFQVNNGRNGKPTPAGLPAIQNGLLGAMPLDLSSIAGLSFYVNSGSKVNTSDKQFAIFIKQIQIGDATAEGTDNEYVLGRKTLSVASSKIHLAAAAVTNAQLTVNSTESWSATSDQDWLQVSTSTDAGNGIIFFSATTNTSNATRSATITVKSATTNCTVLVIQSDEKPKFDIYQLALSVDNNVETVLDTIVANVSWTATSNANWLKLSKESIQNDTFALKIITSKNPTVTNRKAQILVSAIGFDDRLIDIYQSAGDTNLYVSPFPTYISATGNSSVVTVESNVAWKVSTDQSWLHFATNTGEGTTDFEVSADVNRTGANREASLTFTSGSFVVTSNIIQHFDNAIAWTTNNKASENPYLLTLEFSDTTKLPNKPFNSNKSVYTLLYDEKEQALRIDFDFTNQPETDFYSAVNYNWVSAHNQGDASFNPFTQLTDSILGIFVNAKYESARIQYKTMDLDGDAYLRLDVMDANGRWSNADDNSQVITASDTYQTIHYSLYDLYDGYSGDFWQVNNGRYGNTTPVDGLPALEIGSIDALQLDLNHIAGLGFIINSGSKASTADKKFSLLIKKISIGDKYFENTADEIVLGRNTLSVATTEVRLPKAASKASVAVTSSETWTASSDQNWLTVSTSETTGDGLLTFTATTNTTSKVRRATITLTSTTSSRKIQIVQSIEASKCVITNQSITVSKVANEAHDTIVANVAWNVTSDAQWLFVSPKTAQSLKDTTPIVIRALKNPSILKRTAQIVVSALGLNDQFIDITQDAGDTAISVQSNIVNFATKNASQEFSVYSNAPWHVVAAPEWLNGPNGASGDSTFIISADDNTTGDVRSGKVIIAAGTYSVTIDVTQEYQAEALWISNKKPSDNPYLVTYDFSDTSDIPWNFFTGSTEIYKVSYDKTEKALRIDFDYSSQTDKEFWGLVSNNWISRINGGAPTFNPFTSVDDSVSGLMLNILQSSDVNLTYKFVDLNESAQLRIDLRDANGRASNASSSAKLLASNASYNNATFSYNSLSDRYSGNFFGINNGRGNVVGDNLLPKLTTSDNLPLDEQAIIGWDMYINPGNAALSASDKKFSLLIKKLSIGDQYYGGSSYEKIFGGIKPTISLSKSTLKTTDTLVVSSNVDWSYTNTSDWINVVRVSDTLFVFASENQSSESRSDYLRIIAGKISKDVAITQNGTPIARPLTDNITIEKATASSKSAFVLANVTTNISTQADWLHVALSSATFDAASSTLSINPESTLVDTYQLWFIAATNTSTVSRSTNVRISAPNVEDRFIVITQAAASPELSITTETISLAATDNATASLTVKANTSWAAVSSEPWLAVSLSGGNFASASSTVSFASVTSTNTQLYFTAASNTSIIERTGTVYIVGSDLESKAVKITQAAASPVLSITTETISLAATDNATASLTVKANTSWAAVSSEPWLAVSLSGGNFASASSTVSFASVTSTNTELYFTAISNTTSIERTAKVYITSSGTDTYIVSITQAAAQQTLSTAVNTISIDAKANSKSNTSISSNTSWTAQSDAEWLKVSLSDVDFASASSTSLFTAISSTNTTIYFVADKNTIATNRTATVTVKTTNGITKQITITQAAAEIFVNIPSNTFTVTASTNKVTEVLVDANTSWTTSTDASWITITKTDSGFTFTTASNATTTKRTGTISILVNGLVKQTITVTQDANPTDNDAIPALQVSVYPNPFVSELVVNTIVEADVQITTLTGQLVIQKHSTGETKLDVSSLAPGTYIITLTSSNESYQQKLIKQ